MPDLTDDRLPYAPRSMIDRGLTDFRQRRVLMLQGPIGPFFSRLAQDLSEAGARVYKINFNGGDWLFARQRSFQSVVDYRGTMSDWPSTLEALIAELQIDTVLLFGDCRPVHVPAIAIAKRLGIEIGVFEEGYLRPDFITIERDGVNNHSTLPKDAAFYRHVKAESPLPTAALGSTFGRAALWGALYYCAASLGNWRFPHHQHHRSLGWRESRFWARSVWRKLRYRLSEGSIEQRFIGPKPSRFFLVALQTSGDAQVRVHSPFRTVERFIEFVIRDFAAHAPADVELAIKHHPLDRGFSDHSALISRLALELGVVDRCHYLHDQHLPTLLRKTLGVVTINSTVGLSAVGEGIPVIACGEAIYDIEGLAYKGPLARFWSEAPAHRPDFELWRAFRTVLVSTTQFNGSFYKRHPAAGFASGVFWDKHLPTQIGVERLPYGRPLRPSLPTPDQPRAAVGVEPPRIPFPAIFSPASRLLRAVGRLPARRQATDDDAPSEDRAATYMPVESTTGFCVQEQAFEEQCTSSPYDQEDNAGRLPQDGSSLDRAPRRDA